MWGQRSGMSMCTDCKALWGKFVICEDGLCKINWIELIIRCLEVQHHTRWPQGGVFFHVWTSTCRTNANATYATRIPKTYRHPRTRRIQIKWKKRPRPHDYYILCITIFQGHESGFQRANIVRFRSLLECNRVQGRLFLSKFEITATEVIISTILQRFIVSQMNANQYSFQEGPK